jgi:hypothetical protein
VPALDPHPARNKEERQQIEIAAADNPRQND